MQAIRLFFTIAALAALAGCMQTPSGDERTNPAVSEAAPAEQAAKPAGSFATAPDFKLPVPVSRAEVAVPLSQESRQLTSDDVQLAVLEGMGGAASDIKVRVQDGMVYLDGRVDNVADLQRANYIARALPGVIEVDQKGLQVRN